MVEDCDKNFNIWQAKKITTNIRREQEVKLQLHYQQGEYQNVSNSNDKGTDFYTAFMNTV